MPLQWRVGWHAGEVMAEVSGLSTGAVKEGNFTYDSGGAPSRKSGSCRVDGPSRCARKSASNDVMKIKYLVATGVCNDPILECNPRPIKREKGIRRIWRGRP
jgi:hypothetical protein